MDRSAVRRAIEEFPAEAVRAAFDTAGLAAIRAWAALIPGGDSGTRNRAWDEAWRKTFDAHLQAAYRAGKAAR